jgi:hypothetical protein
LKHLNSKDNGNSQKALPGGGRRIGLTAAAATLACAGIVTAIVFKGSPAHTAVVSEVHGGLINPEPASNAAPAVVSTPPQAPAVIPSPGIRVPVITQAPAVEQNGYLQVGFDRLAGFPIRLHWELVDPVRIQGVQKVLGEIPGGIKSLDNGKVAVRGFMLPLKLENGLVTEFLLMRTQARCCYGLPIQVNEVLSVRMAKPVKSLMDQPVTVYGRLHLSESRDPNGALSSIYTMDGDKLKLPESL